MELIKGNDVAAAMNERIKKEAEGLGGYLPRLAIIRVGVKPDDISYERGAAKRMEKLGLRHVEYSFPEDVAKEEFYHAFDAINADTEVDGILLLRPLPKHLGEKELELRIDPLKDVDGINPLNLAKVMSGETDGFAPCTAEAVIEMLDYAGIDPGGKRVAVVGRSLVVGKPLAMLLINRNATVTVCHTRTADLPGTCRGAQILVAAAGRAKMIGAGHVGKDAVVIDVGINVDEGGKLCGDVDMTAIEGQAGACTPVPGGVGTVTTSVLAGHVVQAAVRKQRQRT